MKKLQKSKKGFTLVELAIVIAVIAILIAVLVPTFISLINKANESSDQQVIYNVNNALAIENATDSIDTPEEALDVAAKAGYNMDALSPTSDGNVIVYDQKSVSFALVSESGSLVYGKSGTTIDLSAPTTWYIVDETAYSTYNTADSNNYQLAKTSVKSATGAGITNGGHTVSYILKGEWSNDEISYTGMGGIYTKTASGITTVNYTIKTVDSSYKLNMAYSVSEEVKTVATKIDDTTLTTYVIQKSCSTKTATTLTVSASVTSAISVNFEVEEEDTSPILYDTTSTYISVTVSTTNGTDVTEEVATGVTDVTTAVIRSDDDTIELGTKNYPYLISSVSEWISKLTATGTDKNGAAYGGYYWKVTEDLDFTDATENYAIGYFKGNIDFGDKTITIGSDTNVISGYYALFNAVYGGSTLSNVNLVLGNNYIGLITYGYLKGGDITLSNITTSGLYKMTTNNVTAFMDRVYGYGNDYVLTFKNCTSNATIAATGGVSAGIFLGKVDEHDNYSYAKLVFDNCINTGTLTFANGYASMLIANGCTFTSESLDNITVIDCVNKGTICGNSSNSNLLCGGGQAKASITQIQTWVNANSANLYNDGGVCVDKTPVTITTSDDNFALSSLSTTGTATSYSISFTFWVTVYDKEGGTKITHGSYTITHSVDSLSNLSLPAYSWISESALSGGEYGTSVTIGTGDDAITLKTYIISGTTYYVFEESNVLGISGWATSTEGYVTISNVSLTIYEYINSSIGNIYIYTY